MADHSVPMAQRISQIVREARLAKDLTQAKLAEEINVDDRTIRKWESGEDAPNFSHRKDLAHLLGIQPELLSLQRQTDYSLEDAQLLVRNIGLSLDHGAFVSALSSASLLVRNLTRQTKRGDVDLRVPLNHARYLEGHSLSIVQNDALLALKDFRIMGREASKLGDQTLLCTALTYQGEMYRRIRDYDKAIYILKRAPQGPDVDSMVIGNSQQLLARVYTAINDIEAANEAMKQAEMRALAGQAHSRNLYVCFNQCSVSIDYAKIALKLGNTREALKHIGEAEKFEKDVIKAKRWLIPILLVKGEILLRMVADVDTRDPKSILNDPYYEQGRDLVIGGYLLAREYGHQRQVQHARKLINRFGQRATNHIRIAQDLEERLSAYNKDKFNNRIE